MFLGRQNGQQVHQIEKEQTKSWNEELYDRSKLTEPIKSAEEKWKLLPAFFKVRTYNDIDHNYCRLKDLLDSIWTALII
jgi:hypothetical protein